jgi:tetratricopeptide (TPR) repeat protein
LALKYLHEGKLDAAESVLKQLLKQDDPAAGRLAEHNFMMAQVLELEFKTPQALDCYRKAYALEPDNVLYGLAYAHVTRQLNRLPAAEQTYNDLLSLKNIDVDTDHSGTYYRGKLTNDLAGIYAATNRFDDAARLLKETNNLILIHTRARYARAEIPFDQLEAAEAVYSNNQSVLAQVPHSPISPIDMYHYSEHNLILQLSTLQNEELRHKNKLEHGAVESDDQRLASAHLYYLDAELIWSGAGCQIVEQIKIKGTSDASAPKLSTAIAACSSPIRTVDPEVNKLSSLDPLAYKPQVGFAYAQCFSVLSDHDALSRVVANPAIGLTADALAQSHSAAEECRIRATSTYEDLFAKYPGDIAESYVTFLQNDLRYCTQNHLDQQAHSVSSTLKSVSATPIVSGNGGALKLWNFYDQ